MGWFNRKPTQEKYLQAAVTVASNLYAITIPGGSDAPVTLEFGLPDSRYRYLIFCLSTAAMAAIVYDEEKNIQPDRLVNGCLSFATWAATHLASEYFGAPATAEESSGNAAAHFQYFLNQWSRWPALEKDGRNLETIDLICSMIHTTESNEPASPTDLERLGPLGLDICCRLPTMRRAFVGLAKG
jgi:hypothetical protein